MITQPSKDMTSAPSPCSMGGGVGLPGLPGSLSSRLCAACNFPIQDKFFMNVLNRAWHQHCVTCTDCQEQLEEKCFTRDGKIYCKAHFFRRFGAKCSGCGDGISPTDLVRRARGKAFHLSCFTCCVCHKQLATGEELYFLEEDRFMCKADFAKKFGTLQGSGSDNEDGDTDEALQSRPPPLLTNGNGTSEPSRHPSEADQSFEHLDHPSNRSGSVGSTPGSGPINPVPGPNGVLHNTSNNSQENSLNLSSGSRALHSLDSKGSDEISDSFDAGDLAGLDSPKGSEEDMVIKKEDGNDSDGNGSGGDDKQDGNSGNSGSNAGSKRRGPRTTIKAKQLETLKAAFAATPKPTRHIREQLAQETGLNMRVIQVWFQNRRSKERRMKQLNAMGHRRGYFRSRNRLRGSLDGADFSDGDMMSAPRFGYYPENVQGNGEFFHGNFPGYNGDFGGFPPGGGPPDGMGGPFVRPPPGPMPMDPSMGNPPGPMVPDPVFMPEMGIPVSEGMVMNDAFVRNGPPLSLPPPMSGLAPFPHTEHMQEAWG